MRKYWK